MGNLRFKIRPVLHDCTDCTATNFCRGRIEKIGRPGIFGPMERSSYLVNYGKVTSGIYAHGEKSLEKNIGNLSFSESPANASVTKFHRCWTPLLAVQMKTSAWPVRKNRAGWYFSCHARFALWRIR